MRNTEWIYAVSIYTGHESKIMKNSSKSRSKKSKLEITTNKYILRGILFQTFLCILASTFSTIFNTQKISYLNSDDADNSKPIDILWYITTPIMSFGSWFLAMMNFVAISLLVSLEMVKFT